MLQSDKDPTQYGGQAGGRPMDRLAQHKRDIEKGDMSKAVAKHFRDTKSDSRNIIFRPFMKIKSDNPNVRLYFERKFLNDHNMVSKGINKIL